MDISIVIVNYNTAEHLRECLNTIIKYTKINTFELIVVDNNSPDRLIESFPVIFPEVNFVFRSVNDGFGAGCNFGAEKATGKYIAFINPDIVIDSNCLLQLYEFMEGNQNAGACIPLMRDFDGNLSYVYNNFPGYQWEFYEALGQGTSTQISKLLKAIDVNSKKPFEIDWGTGAFLIVRAEIFKKLKGYDDKFFLYYEDTDLQYRIHEEGYKVVCLPFVEVKHFTNSSIKSDEGENIYFYNMNRSKLIYMYKHFNFVKRNIIRIMHILGILIRTSFLPFREKFKGKKDQKYLQYKKMLCLYFFPYKKLLQSQYIK